MDGEREDVVNGFYMRCTSQFSNVDWLSTHYSLRSIHPPARRLAYAINDANTHLVLAYLENRDNVPWFDEQEHDQTGSGSPLGALTTLAYSVGSESSLWMPN